MKKEYYMIYRYLLTADIEEYITVLCNGLF